MRAIGGLPLPALLKQGYRDRFSIGLLTASGSLGLLFPLSLPLILALGVQLVTYVPWLTLGILHWTGRG